VIFIGHWSVNIHVLFSAVLEDMGLTPTIFQPAGSLSSQALFVKREPGWEREKRRSARAVWHAAHLFVAGYALLFV